jgi:hypothetical protein
MSPFMRTASGWGAILTILVLVITLLRQLISLVTFLITALKVGIVVVFVGLMLLIVLAIFRGRSRRRKEAEDI